MGSSEKLSSNLWLAIPLERANSCSSFLLFQITMFKFIVLSSLVMMLCIDPVFPTTTTVTSTTTKYTTKVTEVVSKAYCIKSSANIAACRRRRGILYDIGNEQADQYMFNGFRIVPVSSLPRIQADPIGFENLQEQNNQFLSGESYIVTSMHDNSAIQPGSNRAMSRIFFGTLWRNRRQQLRLNSKLQLRLSLPIVFRPRLAHVRKKHLNYNIPTTEVGKRMILLACCC